MDIRAADWVGRTVKVGPGNPTCLVGRLVSVRHNGSGGLPAGDETKFQSLNARKISTASAWLSSTRRSFSAGGGPAGIGSGCLLRGG
jgi:hypothetical protein